MCFCCSFAEARACACSYCYVILFMWLLSALLAVFAELLRAALL